MLRSVVSNTAERSRKQRHDNFCDPMTLMRWSWIYNRAVSAEWCSRQTDENWDHWEQGDQYVDILTHVRLFWISGWRWRLDSN